MQFEWKGVFPALLTPFTADGSLDTAMFLKNLDAQMAAGVHGIILGGTLGEASVLTTEEKHSLVATAVKHVKDKIPVVLNIAEGSTAEALHQAKLAESWGASGLMLLPPMRYRPDHREAVTWFKTVAQSTALSIMIYNNPVDYKVEVTLDMFEELSVCTNINAVKESTRDITNVTRMINRFGNRFSILCGVDTIAMESMLMGAQGWVAGLVDAFPLETVKLYDLLMNRQLDDALRLYRWLMPLLELDIHPKLVQYIKLAAAETGIGSEHVRAPRLILEGEERGKILSIIRKAIASRPSFT